MKQLDYLGRMKLGVFISFVVHTILVILAVYVYVVFDSIIRIPNIFKIMLIFVGGSSALIDLYVNYHLLCCPFCKKAFKSVLKYRLFATRTIPHRCPNCGVVIDYTRYE